jgi:hypothetical protein
MSRTGYTSSQQHQVRQLIFECSIAKMFSFQTQQVLKDKLDVHVTISWINRIKTDFKEDARREYYHLLTDNFAYKYLTMEVMQQLHEIIKQQWDIANNNKGKSDLIALKAYSELRESVLRVSEFYKYLPEVENNLFSLKRNHKDLNESLYLRNFETDNGNDNTSNSKYQDINSETFDLNKEPSLTEDEKEQIRNGTIYIAGRDTKTGELYVDCNHIDSDVPDCEYCNDWRDTFRNS